MGSWGRAAVWDVLCLEVTEGGVTVSLWALGSHSHARQHFPSSLGWHRAPAAPAGALGSGGRKKEHPQRGEQPEPQLCSLLEPGALQLGREEMLGGVERKLGVSEERRGGATTGKCPRVGSGVGHSGAVLGGTGAAAAPRCSPHVSRGWL